jgi:Tryptophan-associated transmembrane protein (Trp_oprn_chp)
MPDPAAPAGHVDAAADRRSLRLAALAVLLGVVLAVVGAGRPWVRVSGALPAPGGAPLAAVPRPAAITGNDRAPLAGIALLALVLLVGVAATRGRGRWAVGVGLLADAALLGFATANALAGLRGDAARRALRGELPGVTGGHVQVGPLEPAGPLLLGLALVLLAGAGVEALRRGPAWPALGAAFRAPPDRPAPARAADGEPPWEGD